MGRHEEGLLIEDQPSKANRQNAPKMELKPLPPHLMYEFLGPNRTFLITDSTKLNDARIEKVLCVFQKHRGVISYSIDDIKGISSSFCMHLIFINNEHRPFRQPQFHLNPNMQ